MKKKIFAMIVVGTILLMSIVLIILNKKSIEEPYFQIAEEDVNQTILFNSLTQEYMIYGNCIIKNGTKFRFDTKNQTIYDNEENILCEVQERIPVNEFNNKPED